MNNSFKTTTVHNKNNTNASQLCYWHNLTDHHKETGYRAVRGPGAVPSPRRRAGCRGSPARDLTSKCTRTLASDGPRGDQTRPKHYDITPAMVSHGISQRTRKTTTELRKIRVRGQNALFERTGSAAFGAVAIDRRCVARRVQLACSGAPPVARPLSRGRRDRFRALRKNRKHDSDLRSRPHSPGSGLRARGVSGGARHARPRRSGLARGCAAGRGWRNAEAVTRENVRRGRTPAAFRNAR